MRDVYAARACRSPDGAVLVNNGVTHEVTTLEYLCLERCKFAVPPLLLLEIYDYIPLLVLIVSECVEKTDKVSM